MAGRKSKPTRLKLIQGNPGKRPINGNEPEPARGIPTCPAWLSAQAKAAWEELSVLLDDMGVLTLADSFALELLSTTYCEWRAATEAIEKHGEIYKTTTQQGDTMHRPRPEVAMRADAARRLTALLSCFGLEPGARSRLCMQGKKEGPLDAYLRRGRELKH